jgi:hypothetical protein
MIQSHLLRLTAVITMVCRPRDRADLARNRLDTLRRLASAAVQARGRCEASRAERSETFMTLVLRSEMPRWRRCASSCEAARASTNLAATLSFA